jgi:hypothetical protein
VKRPAAPARQDALFGAPPTAQQGDGAGSDHPLAVCGERLFAQHAGLPPRYGWLAKGYAALREDPEAFAAADACVRLGVGRGALTAIRYWMCAFHLAAPGPRRRPGRPRALLLTPRAHWLLDPDRGADPYLEDDASLWLLHHWLLEPPCRAPSWWLAFHQGPAGAFSRSQLERRIITAADQAGWKAPTPDQVRRDVSCLIRMYSSSSGAGEHESVEDRLNRPFATLNLITVAADQARIPFGAGRRAPAALVLMACLEYAHRRDPAPGGIALSRLAADVGAPGRSLRLLRSDLADKLHHAADGDDVAVNDAEQETARLAYRQPPAALAAQALARLYPHAPAEPTIWPL